MNAPAAAEESLLGDYRPPADAYDELMAADGEMRPAWGPLVERLDRLGRAELHRRWEQAQRQIVNDDVTFNPHDLGGGSRPWLLDAVPLLLSQKPWQEVTAGLEQRARLLDTLLRDWFGARMTLRDRLAPAELLLGHPSFHPAFHGLNPPGKRHLHLYAADLARSPDGRWWVTSDRTRSPFGLGYVLENRIVASRMLPAAFRDCRAERLARFFIELREALRELAPRYRDNPRIAVWTKGSSSRAYFEDAYLARYMGYTLVEGDDLAVRDNRVMLKTLGGLLPVEVLFRRLDDEDCDPVELRSDSRFGVSGLVESLRGGNVAVANGLGSRLVESPALLAFLPTLCKRLLGEELRLPSVATWWCGQPEALQYVTEHLDELVIRPAFRAADSVLSHPQERSAEQRDELLARLKANPSGYVGQETVQRSTAPVWSAEGLAPWRLALRSFLIARGEQFHALPGGLARVSPEAPRLDQNMTTGERSQDVWILADGPIEDVSLLGPPGQQMSLRRGVADLPSRVADSLFWLGRNIERAESSARLLRTVLVEMTSETEGARELPLMLRSLAEQGQIAPDYVIDGFADPLPRIEAVLPEMIFDAKESQSLRTVVNEAVRLASMVRDRIAVDAWRVIHRLDELSRRPPHRREIDAAEALAMLDRVVTVLMAFSGLAGESMTRTQGWRFLDLGRRIERAFQTAQLLRSTLASSGEDERPILEAVLETLDSIMTYRARYLATLQVAPVLDLLIADETNPRSIGHQMQVIVEHVDRLPRPEHQAVRTPEQRIAMSLQNSVRLADMAELAAVDYSSERSQLAKLLTRLIDQLPKLSDAVSSRYLIHAGLTRQFAAFIAETRE